MECIINGEVVSPEIILDSIKERDVGVETEREGGKDHPTAHKGGTLNTRKNKGPKMTGQVPLRLGLPDVLV